MFIIFYILPLHVSALVGHLQEEYTIILGSYSNSHTQRKCTRKETGIRLGKGGGTSVGSETSGGAMLYLLLRSEKRSMGARGSVVVKARYKLEGRGFDTR
jgi:hypothetical protein